MTNEDTKTVEINYNNKVYEIEKDAKEQVVRPKGITHVSGDEETENNRAIKVKDYKEGFWNTSVNVNEVKLELKWGKGKYLFVWGGIPAFLITLLYIGYRMYVGKEDDKGIKEMVDGLVKSKDKE